MKLSFILKDSNYKLSQFNQEEINDLENSIFLKQTAKSSNYYINSNEIYFFADINDLIEI
ncbi:hypothetical protein ACN4EE_07475 [Geminocystis sp. CENA526]|uniref:hypothetical protein n=1 Tax=Geminocystis sp. CENA526 TaxID=1355871 RepID=UPI003D6FF25F